MKNTKVTVGSKVGLLKQKVIDILSVNLLPAEIFLLWGGIKHIKNKRLICFKNHLNDIPEIIKNPEYIGTNPKYPDSVEFLKEMGGVNILVAVSQNLQGILQIATMYDVTSSKLATMIEHNRMKKLK